MSRYLWFVCSLLAAVSWGNYGVGARAAGEAFHHAAEYTFLLVCGVYAVFGVVGSIVPTLLGRDHGRWCFGAAAWGCGAGLAGALGALCVIWAIKSGGQSTVIMALVFGLAQLFNFLFSWACFGLKQKVNWKFLVSFGGIFLGSMAVQIFRPGVSLEKLGFHWGWWLVFTLGTAICWGCYGMCARTSVLNTKHNPKDPADHGSHFQPLFWVSLTYLLFGIGDTAFIAAAGTPDVFNSSGLVFGILTGVAGLAGAAFVIPANSVRGTPGPGVTMGIVFASAAIVNAISNSVFFPAQTDPVVLGGFWCAVIVLAVSTYLFTKNNPTAPPKKPTPAAVASDGSSAVELPK